VRWGVDAILTDVTKTWLDMRAALNGTIRVARVGIRRADGQFRRLRQGWRTVHAFLPLDLALVLFRGPVWSSLLVEAQDGESCGLI
jgi:hypothetical protein